MDLNTRGLKQCRKCLAIKVFSEYKKTGHYLSSWCKICLARVQRKYYRENRPTLLAKTKARRIKNSTRDQEYHRNWKRNLRLMVITAYGKKCACCGEKTYQFLSIDHVHGGGRKHRDELKTQGYGSGSGLYQWLKVNSFPPGFQILCYNCNCAKGHYGECPHETKRQKNNHHRAR